MRDEEEWRVSDLLDNDQPFVEDVTLARQLLDTLNSIETINQNEESEFELGIRIPKASIEFIENTLNELFETVAEIEKKRGNMPYLIDRSLFPKGQIEWNQGLTCSDLTDWYNPDNHWEYEERMHEKAFFSNRIVKIDEPLSGYYNRLLPVKFVLRVFAMMLFNSDEWDKEHGLTDDFAPIPLSKLREISWKNASYAHDFLVEMDKNIGSERGSEISIGFPKSEDSDPKGKSKERFVAQFVGSKRKNRLSGAIFDMGLANLSGMFGLKFENDVRFTRAGFRFALLDNPVLDSLKGWEGSSRFTEVECEVLLTHFKANVTKEWEFLLQIADLIRDGVNRSEPINEELMSSHSWDSAKASIMRTGVIARMQELGLIDRERSGVEITFVLTELGERVLVKDYKGVSF